MFLPIYVSITLPTGSLELRRNNSLLSFVLNVLRNKIIQYILGGVVVHFGKGYSRGCVTQCVEIKIKTRPPYSGNYSVITVTNTNGSHLHNYEIVR